MRTIYSFLMILITPLIVLRLWWKGRLSRLSERFALNPTTTKSIDIWVHAVSLGEVIAVSPLIQALLDQNYQVLVTTMTPTGSHRVISHFGNKVTHQYVPYDLPWVLPRFFKRMQPQFGIIMETELWPNMIHYANKAQIPLYLINARISDNALQQYQKLAFFFKPFLQQFVKICAQSEEDGRRFRALGADNVEVLGNIKFDVPHNPQDLTQFVNLKSHWDSNRPILIAASTHANEEALILSQLQTLQEHIPKLLLLIAPRHPERFQEVYTLSRQQYNTGLRSQAQTLSSDMEVIIVDSLGELNGFFAISDYAFIGGSLVPVGGHNVLEPIAAKIPVFCGLYMQNSQSICLELQKAGGLVMVSDVQALVDAIIKVHLDKELRDALVKNASEILDQNRGVVARYLDVFVGELSPKLPTARSD